MLTNLSANLSESDDPYDTTADQFFKRSVEQSNSLGSAMKLPSFYSEMTFTTKDALEKQSLKKQNEQPVRKEKVKRDDLKNESPVDAKNESVLEPVIEPAAKKQQVFVTRKTESAEVQLMLSLKTYMNKITIDKETLKAETANNLTNTNTAIQSTILQLQAQLDTLRKETVEPSVIKLDDLQSKYELELPLIQAQSNAQQLNLESVERVINTLLSKLGKLESIIEDKTEHLQANINETIKHVNDDLAGRDRSDEINREMFGVALSRLSKGEVFIDNQRTDNENIRSTIQKVEEMLLSKQESDREAIWDKQNELEASIEAIHSMHQTLFEDGTGGRNLKRALEGLEETRVSKKLKKSSKVAVVVRTAATTLLGIGAVGLFVYNAL